ncbi:hypothetical protein SALBM311S_09713 [Streptomyces alboniger]
MSGRVSASPAITVAIFFGVVGLGDDRVLLIFTPRAFSTAAQNRFAEAGLGGVPKDTDMTLTVDPSPGVRATDLTRSEG